MNCSRKLGPNTTNVNRVVRLIVDNVPFGWSEWIPNLFVLWDDYHIDCMEHTKGEEILITFRWMYIRPFWQLNTDYTFRFISIYFQFHLNSVLHLWFSAVFFFVLFLFCLGCMTSHLPVWYVYQWYFVQWPLSFSSSLTHFDLVIISSIVFD